jgi:hypothetical protein
MFAFNGALQPMLLFMTLWSLVEYFPMAQMLNCTANSAQGVQRQSPRLQKQGFKPLFSRSAKCDRQAMILN